MDVKGIKTLKLGARVLKPVYGKPTLHDALTTAIIDYKLENLSLWHNGREWVASIRLRHAYLHIVTGEDPYETMTRAVLAASSIETPFAPPKRKVLNGNLKKPATKLLPRPLARRT